MLRAILVSLLVVLAARPSWADEAPSALPCPETCCESIRFETRAELLVWWLRSGRLPPLVTAESGVIYGDEKIDTNRHLGGRLTLDGWLCDCLGVRGSFLVLERNSREFDVKSPGDALIARPYTDAQTGLPAAEVLAGPTPAGTRSGGFFGLSKIELFGEELALLTPLGTSEHGSVVGFAGPYCLQIRERLDFRAASSLAADASLFGETDRFRADDRFYGGQLGVESAWSCGSWSVGLSGKAALGLTQQVLSIRGDRVTQTPFERIVVPFGFLAQPSNAGQFERDAVSTVFEVDVRCAYDPISHVRLSVGCTFIRWSSVQRAGDGIDTTLSLGAAQGTRPRPLLADDYFWALGVTAGMELYW